MIFFWADGRLGNQLFQYAFLQTIRKGRERIIVSGFDEMEAVFNTIRVINLHCNTIKSRIFLKYIKKVISFLVKTRLISLISMETEEVFNGMYRRESDHYIQKNGLCKSIRFVSLGFFQSEHFFNKQAISHLKIRQDCLDKAKIILSVIPKGFTKIFVHIRLGDYKDFMIYGKSVLLPYDYFHKCIKYFIANIKTPFFVFLSDEPEFITKEFDYVRNKLISTDLHYEIDFSIMTLCIDAILSPSSFGWWGSYFMKNRNIVFATDHWLGFASDVDYHKSPLASYMTPVNVKTMTFREYFE
jgi:hypothetical protein